MARGRRVLTRPLRALLVANDGASVGHVTRAAAVARALGAGGAECLLATTSRADALLAGAGVPSLRLPAPGDLAEAPRRALAARVLAAAVEALRPDVLVVDTFPAGPHGELEAALDEAPRRVLVRRTVRDDRAGDRVVTAGLDRYDLVVVPDDPGPVAPLPPRGVRVPPIVWAAPPAPRPPGPGPRVVVSCGGRGDPVAREVAAAVRAWCAARGHPEPVVADGLLDDGAHPVPWPLAAALGGFDLAVASAGYNSAHEAAAHGVPAVLYARDRAYDDQAARARRFEAAGLAVALGPGDDPAPALDRALALRPPRWPADGAARCAAAIVALVAGR